jgi:guanine deaminase
MGGHRWEADGALVVDPAGRIAWAGPWAGRPSAAEHAPDAVPSVDLRPWVLLPGLIDLHVHLPQVPSAALGPGLDLLAWLDRYVFPLERAFDAPTAERLAPAVYRAMAACGTTTFLGYGAIWPGSLDAAFAAAEAHGIRAAIGKVMMDRVTYDDALPRDQVLDRSLAQSAELCERWHGRDGGRLRYAFTPRFAVACSHDMLRESAALADHFGTIWQTHLSEDRREIETVAGLFPDALDYLDVYDRAGALGPNTVFAHAIHLSDREVDRLAASGARVAHCPASNLFLRSGVMPLGRYLGAGITVGLGSDVAGGPELSMLSQARTGYFAQSARRSLDPADGAPPPDMFGWLRLATLDGARALGQDAAIGSLEVGKEADVIVVDPGVTLPPGGEDLDEPEALLSRLIFREREGMVRGAWVRGRLLPT